MKRIEKVKKMLSVLLCVLMLAQTVPMMAQATQPEQSVLETVTEQIAPDLDLPENEELFAVYAEQVLYGYEIATFGNAAGNRLNGDEKLAYDTLKLVVAQIAAGQRESTSVSLGYGTYNVNVNGTIETWTPEISVDFTEPTDDFDSSAVIAALLSDCPFEMYWYDKTAGCKTTTLNTATLSYVKFNFRVASAYSSGTYKTNTTKTAAAATAAGNAKAVVEANKNKTPYERLVAYRDYICQETSYNHPAADNDSTPYGDPWQLIYVFDGNSATTVVCEGYAKAFQYLCDLDAILEDDDSDDILCVCVSGDMSDGTDAGGHMWNVVTLDGKNYLVDVTNCDDGTVGAPDRLFLVGGTYKNGGYSYVLSKTITYTCDNLNLAQEKYTVPDLGPIETVFINEDTNISHVVEGRTVTVDANLPCRVGYWSGKQYIALTAVENKDASYSFTAPQDAEKILIVIAADINADGRVTASDIAGMNAHLKNKIKLTAEAIFAADVNGDGQLDNKDKSNLCDFILQRTILDW